MSTTLARRQRDVGGHGVGKQEALLKHHPDAGALRHAQRAGEGKRLAAGPRLVFAGEIARIGGVTANPKWGETGDTGPQGESGPEIIGTEEHPLLSALGRVNPVTYDADETLRSLISVVP